MKQNDGFTLMEVLVALMILAIVGVIMMRGLQSAIHTQEHINQNAIKLASLQESMTIMTRDIEEIIKNPILSTDGTYLEFIKIGFINPSGMYPRSSLQRIAYQCHDGILSRLVWHTVDSSTSSPDGYALLTDVIDCQMTFYYGPNKRKQLAMNNNAKKPPPLPDAVQVNLIVKGIGTVTRFIALPG